MKNKYLIFIIIGGVIIGLIIYFVFFYKSASSLVKNSKIEFINTQSKVYYPKFLSEKNTVTFLGDKGIILYQFDLQANSEKKLTDNEFLGINKVIYDSDILNAIFFSDYPAVNVKNYNLTNFSSKDLSSNINNAIFSEDGKNIYYIYNLPDDKCTLNIANPNGTNWLKLTDLDMQNCNYFLHKIDNSLIFTNLNGLFKLNLTGNIKETIIEVNLEQDILVSLDKKNIAYNEIEGTTTKIYNFESKKIIDLKRKIDLDSALILNNSEIIYFKDTKILIKYNFKKTIEQTANLDDSSLDRTNLLDDFISHLFLSSDEKILYFTYNNYLYKISL